MAALIPEDSYYRASRASCFFASLCRTSTTCLSLSGPFANSRTGPHLRNHPFPPTAEDIDRIQLQMGDHREAILEELKKRGVAAKPASG